MIPIPHFLALAALLFALGLLGAILRRNLLIILMSIELMLNAAVLTLIAFSRAWGEHGGQGLAFFVIAIAAAEAAVGLAIVMAVFRTRHTVHVDEINVLKK